VTLHTAPLIHPGRATGYRLEYGDSAIAYVTDTEHRVGKLDRNVLALADHADLMIYDGNFTDDEYGAHVGWGHSTWQEGVRLAEAASVKTLAVFHHDPDHDDDFLDEVAKEADALRPGTVIAREGMVLVPGDSDQRSVVRF
jgi:phosphoribosyl 1,2-cyclic phosphodiesterase